MNIESRGEAILDLLDVKQEVKKYQNIKETLQLKVRKEMFKNNPGGNVLKSAIISLK